MKNNCIILITLILLISSNTFAGVIEPVRLKYTEGDILYQTPDSGGWIKAAVNTPLDEGDSIWSSDGGIAELQLPDGTVMRIDGGSQLNILAVEEKFSHFNLSSGRLYVRTGQSIGLNSLQIDADDTTVLPAGRTRLRLDMLSNGQEDVSIFKGSAYVEGNGSRTKVRAGEHIALEEGRSELLPLNPPDKWENWNLSRDAIQSASQRVDSYLPEELRNYSGELDLNGKWVSVPEFGTVWRPLTVGGEWAPYRVGQWGWRGNEYVWISAESWGWVPYHYGRWTVISGFGWCWIPPNRGEVYWGPGYVGWHRSGSYVGWTPLAPGETYYGYGYYGRHSVNVTTVNINISNVSYINRNYRGGVTVINQNDFISGRSVVHQPNHVTSLSVSAGSPRVRFVNEVRSPLVKPVPHSYDASRPNGNRWPEHKDNRELRSKFPRVMVPERDTQRQNLTTSSGGQANPARHLPPIESPQIFNTSNQTAPVMPNSNINRSSTSTTSINSPVVRGQQAPGSIENNGKSAPQRGDRQKKIWRVRMNDVQKVKETKTSEQKDREHKGK